MYFFLFFVFISLISTHIPNGIHLSSKFYYVFHIWAPTTLTPVKQVGLLQDTSNDIMLVMIYSAIPFILKQRIPLFILLLQFMSLIVHMCYHFLGSNQYPAFVRMSFYIATLYVYILSVLFEFFTMTLGSICKVTAWNPQQSVTILLPEWTYILLHYYYITAIY